MGAAKSSDECFNCHELGHWTQNCPNNSQELVPHFSLETESFDKCFKCHELGHWARNCPNNSTQEQAPHFSVGNESKDECFKCHELGHWAKNCPNNSTEEQAPNLSMGTERKNKCFKCHELGHWAKNCPNNSTQEQVPHFSLGNDVIPPKMCRCGRECLVRISNSSANPGRIYYKCQQCKFFKWCDEVEPSASQNPNPNSPSQNTNPSLSSPSNNPNPNCPPGNPDASAHEESGLHQQIQPSIKCECEAGPCRVVTAKTEKNYGRRFYTCHIKKGEGSCGYFKWCDELDTAASSSAMLSKNSVMSKPEESVRRNGA